MHMKGCMKCSPALVGMLILAAFCAGPARGELEINSFGGNGRLSWEDPDYTGGTYAVEWAPAATGAWQNFENAANSLSMLGATGTASVPMFYRVVSPDPTYDATETYTYFFRQLPTFNPLTPLASNEMRITFMGSMIPLPVRKAQAEMSVFVEVGWNADTNDLVYGGRAKDQFVFDCGAGVSANYAAAKVGFRRMDKVFINHLHGDHMSDLSHIYCFGPSSDRKSPLYVWGSRQTGQESPTNSGIYYDDGTSNFCANLRRALRWHSESFSFQATRYTNYAAPTKTSWGLPHDPVPVENDLPDDAYAMVPIELDWRQVGIAYSNQVTGVKITHYPVIHARKGSMGYKLEWQTPDGTNLTMIYSSDTKPETNSVNQAINEGRGVDVFVHEMVVPPSVWTYKNMGLDGPPGTSSPVYASYTAGVAQLQTVQNSSHSPQGAFGYLLSLIKPKPRLTVATHFPVADDTVQSALQSVQAHTNVVFGQDLIWSFDLLVLRVFPDRIEQRRAVVSDYAFNPPVQLDGGTYAPKYDDGSGRGDPYAQIDLTTQIPATNGDGSVNYRLDGF